MKRQKTSQPQYKNIKTNTIKIHNKKRDVNTINLNKEIGVLDPNGLANNPWTDEPYKNIYADAQPPYNGTYAEIAKKWTSYPVYERRTEFIEAIRHHNVVFVKSGTGSGKTVLVPRYFEHAFNYKAKILITIPRRKPVKSAAEYQSAINDVQVGTFIGYKYRGESKYSEQTQMLYCTDGTLVQIILSNPTLEGIQGVIVDEVHERNIQIDFLLYLLRRVVIERQDFRLVLMSADAPIHLFEKYFAEPLYKFIMLDAGSKTNFPIEDHYLEKPIGSDLFMPEALSLCMKLLEQTHEGDILVFITSAPEANKACKKLLEMLKKDKEKGKKYYVLNQANQKEELELFCGSASAETLEDPAIEELVIDEFSYKELLSTDGKAYNRRVVFATNVAESSITLNGYSIVIDSGYELSDTFFPKTRIQALLYQKISNAQRLQRRGRVGRNRNGSAYYLYTKKEADEMAEYPTASIKKADLTPELLRFWRLPTIEKVSDLISMLSQFIEVPDKERVQVAIQMYVSFQWIEPIPKDDYILSAKGKMGMLWTNGNQPIWEAEALITAWFLGVFYEVAGVLGLIEAGKSAMKQILYSQMNTPERLHGMSKTWAKERKKFYSGNGDWITLHQVWEEFMNANRKSKSKEEIVHWCDKNGLNFNTLRQARNNVRRVRRLAETLKAFESGTIEANRDFEINDGLTEEEFEELQKKLLGKKTVGGARKKKQLHFKHHSLKEHPWSSIEKLRDKIKNVEDAVEVAMGIGYAPWYAKQFKSNKSNKSKKSVSGGSSGSSGTPPALYKSVSTLEPEVFRLEEGQTWVEMKRKKYPTEVFAVQWNSFKGEKQLSIANRISPLMKV